MEDGRLGEKIQGDCKWTLFGFNSTSSSVIFFRQKSIFGCESGDGTFSRSSAGLIGTRVGHVHDASFFLGSPVVTCQYRHFSFSQHRKSTFTLEQRRTIPSIILHCKMDTSPD